MPRPEQKRQNLTRRDFLRMLGGAAFGALTSFTGEKILDWLRISHEVELDWQEAHRYRTPEEFIKAHREWLQNITFGYNLATDHFKEWVCSAENPDYRRQRPIPSPDEIATFISDLNMNEGRIAIRMSQAADLEGNIQLDSYHPYLTALAERKHKLTISSGNKAPRAPEWHPVPGLLEAIYGDNKPTEFGHEIGSEDALGQFGLQYHHNLARHLKQNYDLAGYQVENEHRAPAAFAVNWRLKDEYLLQAIEIVANVLPPTTQIWVNSATLFDMPNDALNLMVAARNHNPSLDGRLLAATNYYARFPYSYLDFGDNEVADTITNNDITGTPLKEVWRKQKQAGIMGGITELQCEPWRDGTKKSEEPGNNLQLLFFSLLRLQRAYSFDQPAPFQKNMPVYLWGIEELFRHMRENDDRNREIHQQIIKFVKLTNDL